jgi:hypothetical protein
MENEHLKQIQKQLDFLIFSDKTKRLMFITFLFLLICHIMGCVWIYASQINVE